MKSIEYAYPTSILATNCGFGEIGCWIVTSESRGVMIYNGKLDTDALLYFLDINEDISTRSFTPENHPTLFAKVK